MVVSLWQKRLGFAIHQTDHIGMDTWHKIVKQCLTTVIPIRPLPSTKYFPLCGTCSDGGTGIAALAVAANNPDMQDGGTTWS